MAKFIKQRYYGKNGEKKINCYHVNISKFILLASGMTENDEIEVKAHDGKIIIEKSK